MRFKFGVLKPGGLLVSVGVLKPGGLLVSVGAGAAAATFNNGDASPAGSVCGPAGNCCCRCKTALSCCDTALEIKVAS